MNDKTKVFLRAYKRFKAYATKIKASDSEEVLVQLFAIHLKDERTDKIIDARKSSPAQAPLAARAKPAVDPLASTPKQRGKIAVLCKQLGAKFTESFLQQLSKKQASQLIDGLQFDLAKQQGVA